MMTTREIVPLSQIAMAGICAGADREGTMQRERLAESDFEPFFHQHWPWVYRVVRRLASDIDVEDAVQDVFVVVLCKLDEFEYRSSLKTWMYRICINIVAEHRRKRRRRHRLNQEYVLADSIQGRSSLHDTVAARSQLALMNELLARLNPKKREVFVLREIEGLSGEEVAEILNVPPATVRTRLHHARKEFAQHLARAGVSNEA